jgi:hypothetical protein
VLQSLEKIKGIKWALLIVYAVSLVFGLIHHELWGDELHSWNIATNSESLLKLIQNSHYEGHPPVWYLILRLVGSVYHNPISMQVAQFVVCVASAYLLVFRLSLPIWVSALLLCGYYFSFEYAVLSRNYGIAVLLALVICDLRQQTVRSKLLYYLLLLVALSNTHLLGLLLAFSFHMSIGPHFIKGTKGQRIMWFGLGLLCLMPSVYFILPPSDSSLGFDFWRMIWNDQQYTIAGQAVPRAFAPLPDWHIENLWNSNYIIEQIREHTHVRLESWLMTIVLLVISSAVLFKSRQALTLFLANVLVTWAVAFFFPLTNARYVGFIFIAFVVAIVFLYQDKKETRFSSILIALILLVQLPGAYLMRSIDAKKTFAKSGELRGIVERHPGAIVTDYWTLNYLTGMTGKSFYCIGFQNERSYIIWNTEMKEIMKNKTLYTRDLSAYFSGHRNDSIYLCSIHTADQIFAKDTVIAKQYQLILQEEHLGSIEKYSNVYLYRVIKR